MRIIIFWTAMTLCTVLFPQTNFAQDMDHDQVELSINFGNTLSEALPLFVFIEGKLSGIVLGIIVIPISRV